MIRDEESLLQQSEILNSTSQTQHSNTYKKKKIKEKVMRLFIAENPKLGRSIAEAIQGTQEKKQGYIIKGDSIITWLLDIF